MTSSTPPACLLPSAVLLLAPILLYYLPPLHWGLLLSLLRAPPAPPPPLPQCPLRPGPLAPSAPILSSPWRFYTDPWTLPLQLPGAQSFTHSLNHERNADFAAMLYAEAGRLYFVDVPGPVCFAQAFFATAGGLSRDALLEGAELFLEVDGGPATGLGPVSSLFQGAYPADLHATPSSTAFGLPPAPLTLAQGWGATGSQHPAFPRPLTYNVERAGSLRSGFVLHAPVCAHSHLRMSWRFPQPAYAPAPALLQEGSDCTTYDSLCQLSTYINLSLLRFPGTALPPPLAQPFNASQPAFHPPSQSPALPALENDVRGVWSPVRLMQEALEGADGARSVYRCGRLGVGGRGAAAAAAAPRRFEVFAEACSSGGVGSLLTFDFPSAPHLLHSARVQLVAEWDGGRGGLRMDLEAFAGPAGPAFSRQEGFFMGEMPRGWAGEGSSSSVLRAQGASSGNASAVATGGLYLALPMPWYHSARVWLEYTGDGREVAQAVPPSFHRYPVLWPPLEDLRLPPGQREREWGEESSSSASSSSAVPEDEDASFEVCASFLVARKGIEEAARDAWGAAAPGAQQQQQQQQPLGYLQSSVRDGSTGEGLSMSQGTGTLLNLSGLSGSLVALSVYLSATDNAFAEGDVRLWGDGSPTPLLWTSGFEDFFNAGHCFSFVPHRVESFSAWDHVGRDFFTRRLFALDAPRFQHSLLAAYEATGLGTEAWRATALFYALPALPPTVTDVLRPVQLLAKEQAAGGAARYSVALCADSACSGAGAVPLTLPLPSSSLAQVYSLTSLVPSQGDWAEVPYGRMGGGAGGGVPLTEQVLALAGPAVISMRLRVARAARSIVLRRLVDVRRSVAVGEVWVGGVRLGAVRAVERAFDSINAFWLWESLALPEGVAGGGEELEVRLVVGVEPAGNSSSSRDRAYLMHQMPAWVEAVWEVHCFPQLEGGREGGL